METFIETYGYWAILIGTFLEGETVLVLGGFLAHRGYLHLTGVVAAAFFGSLCGDSLFFYLGRRHSDFILAHRAVWKEKLTRADRLLSRYRTPLILGFRFLYGLRTIMPFALGITSVPARRFALLNALGAMVWATVVGVGGFLFGQGLEQGAGAG